MPVAKLFSYRPVLYSYCNSFFVRDVHRESIGLINVDLFDILLAISSGIFFCLENGNPVYSALCRVIYVLYSWAVGGARRKRWYVTKRKSHGTCSPVARLSGSVTITVRSSANDYSLTRHCI